jgi:hypothetical protein
MPSLLINRSAVRSSESFSAGQYYGVCLGRLGGPVRGAHNITRVLPIPFDTKSETAGSPDAVRLAQNGVVAVEETQSKNSLGPSGWVYENEANF